MLVNAGFNVHFLLGKHYETVKVNGPQTIGNDQFKTLITPLVAPHIRINSAQNCLSNRSSYGTICHLDCGHIHIGNYQSKVNGVLETFCEKLNKSRIQSKILPCLTIERWRNLMWNIPFNGLSTLLDITVDKIMQSPPLRQHAYTMSKETDNATTALQLSIDRVFIDTIMTYTDKIKPYYTSMHLDVKVSRPPEIESIIGAPIKCVRQV
mgnify:CR=1 FL=1